MIGSYIKRQWSISNHMLVGISGWLSKLTIVFVQLFSIRLLINGLGLEGYAIFALLSALLGWFMLADMGIGSSLQNEISKQRADDKNYSEDVVASVILCAVLLAITIVALYFISPFFAPIYLKQFPSINDGEKIRLFFVTGSIFIGCALGSVSYRIWLAEHKGFISNILPAIAAIISYLGVFVIHLGNLSNNLMCNLVVFFTPSTILPLAAITLHFLRHYKVESNIKVEVVYKIIKTALSFWFSTAVSSMSLQIDYFIISQFLKPQDMVIYSLATKFFWFLLFFYMSTLTSLWPVFSEALAKNEWAIVKSLTKKYLGFGLFLSVISSAILILLMPSLINILAPNQSLFVPLTFLALLAIYQLIRVWSDTFLMILQSMGETKSLIRIMSCQAFLSLILQWYFSQTLGIHGIILGNILSFLATVAWLAPLEVIKHYKYQKIKS